MWIILELALLPPLGKMSLTWFLLFLLWILLSCHLLVGYKYSQLHSTTVVSCLTELSFSHLISSFSVYSVVLEIITVWFLKMDLHSKTFMISSHGNVHSHVGGPWECLKLHIGVFYLCVVGYNTLFPPFIRITYGKDFLEFYSAWFLAFCLFNVSGIFVTPSFGWVTMFAPPILLCIQIAWLNHTKVGLFCRVHFQKEWKIGARVVVHLVIN